MNRTELSNKAQRAFWDVIASHYIDNATGDLSPAETEAFNEACDKVLTSWVIANTKVKP